MNLCSLIGHKYTPRFDYNDLDTKMRFYDNVSTKEMNSSIEIFKRGTYVKDVCTRCGKEILRNPEVE